MKRILLIIAPNLLGLVIAIGLAHLLSHHFIVKFGLIPLALTLLLFVQFSALRQHNSD